MIVKYNNVFFLRGIVSASLTNDQFKCDVNNYATYTNILKFTDWIENPTNTAATAPPKTVTLRPSSTARPPTKVRSQTTVQPSSNFNKLTPNNILNYLSSECGISGYNAAGLVIKGREAARGQFPW